MNPILRTTMILVALTASCGGGSGSGPSTVDGTKQLSAASDSDRSILCDWFAAQVGGYGAVSTCAEGFLDPPADKGECTRAFPRCDVTVDQFESCIQIIVAAHTTCTTASLQAAQTDPACQILATANCFQ